MLHFITDIFTDHTLRTIIIGAAALGVVSGALGTYAVLRKQSLLGDAMSHAALPGIVLAYLIFRVKHSLLLLVGAVIAGWIGMYLVMYIVRTSRVKIDAALGMILSVFFGLGLILLSVVQKIPDAGQAGLDKYLFGQAAAMMSSDIIITTIAGVCAVFLVLLLWKEFKIISFDPAYGESIGMPVHIIEGILTALIVIAIVLGLQMVGVILMSAMIVAPAAAARQWTDRLSVMMTLSALFGALSGIGGALTSSIGAHLPTGPMIVLFMMAFTVISLLFAPHRGIVWQWLKNIHHAQKMKRDALLRSLYYMAQQHDDVTHSHSTAALRAMTFGELGVKRRLQKLAEEGLVRRTGTHQWALTDIGVTHAEKHIAATEPT